MSPIGPTKIQHWHDSCGKDAFSRLQPAFCAHCFLCPMSTPPPENAPDTLSAEIRKLGRILGEIIVKLEGKDIFGLEEKLRLLAKSSRAGDANAERALRDAVRGLTV